MTNATAKRSDLILTASLGAIHKRRISEYAESRGLTIAEALRRIIDAHIGDEPERATKPAESSAAAL